MPMFNKIQVTVVTPYHINPYFFYIIIILEKKQIGKQIEVNI